ncbi:hypothetical protein DITRI_Ditri04bG0133200 [Diplodiscus trichospermus]
MSCSIHHLGFKPSFKIIPSSTGCCPLWLADDVCPHFVSGVTRMAELHDVIVDLSDLQRFIFFC